MPRQIYLYICGHDTKAIAGGLDLQKADDDVEEATHRIAAVCPVSTEKTMRNFGRTA